MIPRLLIFLCIGLFLTGTWAGEATDFEAGLTERSEAGRAALAGEVKTYEGALGQLYRNAVELGDLDDVLAIRKERQRLGREARLTAAELVSDPAELASAMTLHLQRKAELQQQLHQETSGIIDAELERRATEIAALTRSGNIARSQSLYKDLEDLRGRRDRFLADGVWRPRDDVEAVAPVPEPVAAKELAELPEAFQTYTQRPRITRMQISADQSTLLVGGDRRRASLWDVATGKRIQELPSTSDIFWTVDMSPDGSIAAGGGERGTVKVWATETGELMHILKGHSAPVWGARFLPGGDLVTAGYDRTLRVWDLDTGRPVRVVQRNHGVARTLAVVDDEHVIGGYVFDERKPAHLRVIHLPTGRTTVGMRGHTAAITDVEVNPAKTHVLSSSSDRTMRLWDLENGKEVWSALFEGGWLEQVCFSADGSVAFAASDMPGPKVHAVDVATGKTLWSSEANSMGFFGLQPIRVKGKQAVAAASFNGWIKFYEVPK